MPDAHLGPVGISRCSHGFSLVYYQALKWPKVKALAILFSPLCLTIFLQNIFYRNVFKHRVSGQIPAYFRKLPHL